MLFASFGTSYKGKQQAAGTLSRWLKKVISKAFLASNIPLPEQILARLIRSVAASWVKVKDVFEKNVCMEVIWSITLLWYSILDCKLAISLLYHLRTLFYLQYSNCFCFCGIQQEKKKIREEINKIEIDL